MTAPVFFIVGVPRQSRPTHDWKEQADTCGCQAEYDADPDRDWHSEKHPKKASFIMAFVDVSQPRHNAEQCCDFVIRMFRFFAEWH